MKKLVIFAFILIISGCAKPLPPGPRADLAEIVESGVATPMDGITVTGQPDPEALGVFAANGYVAVIDLRGPEEDRGFDEAQALADLGMDYVRLPVASAGDLNFDTARKLDEALARYDGPVLLHCASGNRVGGVLALRERLNGAEPRAALEYGKRSGLTSLEREVKKIVKTEP